MNTVFTLDVEGASETVLVRTVQRDPIKRVVTHADFLRVDPNQTVKVKVPIEVVGDASGVTESGGMIEQKMFQIEVEVASGFHPGAHRRRRFSIMSLERRLAVADLSFGDGVTPLVPRQHLRCRPGRPPGRQGRR